MKKFWLMLLMISSVCLFSACSDDDDNKGENKEKNPISELYMSDEIATGEATNVLGKGFTADAQIFVEDAAGERTKIENVTVNEKGITFTLPSTVATGQYSLILKQDGGEWKLGTFKALKMVEIIQLKKVIGTLADMEMPYDLKYDKYGKLMSLSSTVEYEDEEGEMVTVTQAYEFTYTDNRIEVGGSAIDNENVFPITYTLENGRVVSSKTKNVESDFETGEQTVTDAEYTWSYAGDYLKSMTGTSTTINYNFVKGDLVSIDDSEFTYDTQVNKVPTADVLLWSLYMNMSITNDQLMAYLLGVCGKTSTHLPTYTLDNCVCTLNAEGLVGKGDTTIDMGEYGTFHLIVTFEYETVKVISE